MSLLYFFFFFLLLLSSASTFKITLFADLHYGENPWSDWGPEHDRASDRAMSVLLDREKPDFVVFLGDIITANNLLIANASFYWDQAISSTKNRGIPWATVFGNHDDMSFVWPTEWFSSPNGIPQLRCPPPTSSGSGEETCSIRGTTRLELMKGEIERNSLSRSASGPTDLWPSISNYVLPIKSSKNPQSTVAFMYFLDSGGGSYPGLISNAQGRWFQNKSQEINPGSTVPELVFWHIPSKAYGEVAPAPGSVIKEPCVGSINMEGVAVQDAEWGIMDVLSSRPSVKAVFVGHNHGNDWCCPYKKLWLCYARHTGYGGYGTWPKGARIIDITEQPFSIKSRIRMENGEIHSEVVLSS